MKKVLICLLLFLVPLAQAEPLATSYWGYVTVDSLTKANVLVTVLDSSSNEVARATSAQNALYQVTVPWDDPATPADEGVVDGETITFNADGKTAASRKIDKKGTNNRLDLAVTSSSGGGSLRGGSGGGASGENYSNIEVIEKNDLPISRDVITSSPTVTSIPDATRTAPPPVKPPAEQNWMLYLLIIIIITVALYFFVIRIKGEKK